MRKEFNRNLKEMTGYLQNVRDVISPSDPNTTQVVQPDLRLSMEIHHQKKDPCLWESGGSIGDRGSAIVVLDSNFRTQRPSVCVKPRNRFNEHHALVKIWPGCHILGGFFDPNRYVFGAFTVTSFEYNAETKQNTAIATPYYLDILSEEETHPYVPYTGLDILQSNEYLWNADDWKRIPTIVIQKMCCYMAKYPMWIRHWRAISAGKSARRMSKLLPVGNELTPATSLYTFYQNILLEAQTQRQQYNVNTHLCLRVVRVSEDVVDLYGTLVEKKNTEIDTSSIFMTPLEWANTHVVHLELHKLKSFWYPDQDPWSIHKSMHPTALQVGETSARIFEFLG